MEANDRPLEGLDSLFSALHHPHVDAHQVADLDLGPPFAAPFQYLLQVKHQLSVLSLPQL